MEPATANSDRLSDSNQYTADEIAEGELEVDWEGMYDTEITKISKLVQEGNYQEAKKEIKEIRKIPLAERVKIIHKKYKTNRKISGITEVEAVRKYINDEVNQKNCLGIFEAIRDGIMKLEDRKECCSGISYYEKIGDVLLNAAKQAIEANDLPSLMIFSKGCFLPSNGSIYSDSDTKYYSLFEYSCKVYAIDCALYLLEEGGGIEQEFEHGFKPLTQALRRRNEEISVYIIEKGAEVNVSDYISRTSPLHLAAERNCFEVAKLLVERGAEIEARNWKGETPLHFGNSIEIAKLLIEKGADIKSKDRDERTPLLKAVENDRVEISKLLIEKGADIGAEDVDGKTPFNEAALKNMIEFVKFLIERGADIETKNKHGKTPLYSAVEGHSIEVAQLLIEKGANIEAKTKCGRTPLHWAAILNSVEVAKLLIEKKTVIDAKDNDGNTPLHYAVWSSFEFTKLLLDSGANIESKNKKGETPLENAKSDQIRKVFEFTDNKN